MLNKVAQPVQFKGVGGVQQCRECYIPTLVSHQVRLCRYHAAMPRLLDVAQEVLADMKSGLLENQSARAERARLRHIQALESIIAIATSPHG